MPGLVPVIPLRDALRFLSVDGRDKPGHDESVARTATFTPRKPRVPPRGPHPSHPDNVTDQLD